MSQNVIEAGHRFRGPYLLESRREEVVATFETHAEATRAIEALADAGFPVEKGAIIARDIELVERVIGRLTSWRAALKGAVIGSIVAAVVGLALGMFRAIDLGLGLALSGLLLGAIAGAVVGWACHIAEHERPVLESASSVRASAFDLVVTENAGEAARIVDEAQRSAEPGGTKARRFS
jgi:hypothetical protein